MIRLALLLGLLALPALADDTPKKPDPVDKPKNAELAAAVLRSASIDVATVYGRLVDVQVGKRLEDRKHDVVQLIGGDRLSGTLVGIGPRTVRFRSRAIGGVVELPLASVRSVLPAGKKQIKTGAGAWRVVFDGKPVEGTIVRATGGTLTLRLAAGLEVALPLDRIRSIRHGARGRSCQATTPGITLDNGDYYRANLTAIEDGKARFDWFGPRALPLARLASVRFVPAAPVASPATLLLTDGSQLGGAIVAATPERLTFATGDSRIAVAWEHVYELRVGPADASGALTLSTLDRATVTYIEVARLARPRQASPPKATRQDTHDVVILEGGDRASGRLVELGAETVTLECALGVVKIPRRAVRRVAFAAARPVRLGVSVTSNGLRVTRLADGGGAAGAGVQVGDALVALDGRPIATLADLKGELAMHGAGRTVAVTLRRGDRTMTVRVTLQR